MDWQYYSYRFQTYALKYHGWMPQGGSNDMNIFFVSQLIGTKRTHQVWCNFSLQQFSSAFEPILYTIIRLSCLATGSRILFSIIGQYGILKRQVFSPHFGTSKRVAKNLIVNLLITDIVSANWAQVIDQLNHTLLPYSRICSLWDHCPTRVEWACGLSWWWNSMHWK